jgi:hypothetical protein
MHVEVGDSFLSGFSPFTMGSRDGTQAVRCSQQVLLTAQPSCRASPVSLTQWKVFAGKKQLSCSRFSPAKIARAPTLPLIRINCDLNRTGGHSKYARRVSGLRKPAMPLQDFCKRQRFGGGGWGWGLNPEVEQRGDFLQVSKGLPSVGGASAIVFCANDAFFHANIRIKLYFSCFCKARIYFIHIEKQNKTQKER